MEAGDKIKKQGSNKHSLKREFGRFPCGMNTGDAHVSQRGGKKEPV